MWTSGIFSEEQDWYLDTIDFANVDKNLLFFSMGSPGETNVNDFQIGTANIFDKFYLGTWFKFNTIGKQGDMGSDQSNDATSSVEYFENPTGVISSKTTTVDEEAESTFYLNNAGQATVGFGKHGVTLYAEMDMSNTKGSFDTTGTISTSTVITSEDMEGNLISEAGTVYDDEGFENSSVTRIYAGYGTPLEVAGMTINLRGGIFTGISDQSYKYTEKNFILTPNAGLADFDGKDDVDYYEKTSVSSNNGGNIYLQPEVSGSTTFETPLFGGTTLDVGLAYNFGISLNSTDGEITKYTEWDADTISNPGYIETTLVEEEENDETETSYMKHEILPSITLTKDLGDTVMLGFTYAPSVEFSSQTDESRYSDVITTTFEDGTDNTAADYVEVDTTKGPTITTTTKTVTYDYDLGIATQFMFKERLRINVGAEATVQALEFTTEVQEVDGIQEQTVVTYYPDEDGNSVVDSYTYDETTAAPEQREYNVFSDIDMTYNAGFTFFYSENLQLDMMADMSGFTDSIFSLKPGLQSLPFPTNIKEIFMKKAYIILFSLLAMILLIARRLFSGWPDR